MTITRRTCGLFSLCAAAQRARSQQGVAARKVKLQAAPVPSGRPFNARVEGIAASAGLHSSVIYGGVESKNTSWQPTVVAVLLLITTTTVSWTSSCFQAPDWRELRPKRRIACTRTIATAPSRIHETHSHLAANQPVTLREGIGRVANKGWSRT
jgi:hypothetical protein